MKIYFDLYKGNSILNYKLAPTIEGVWFKLVDGSNPKDSSFDGFFSNSKGQFKRGIYAFPAIDYTPLQNYDRIMSLYPSEDGELSFLLDMEKDDNKTPQRLSDETHELLTRLDVTLGRLSTIYTRKEWWDRKIAPAGIEWYYKYDFMISYYPYTGDRIHKTLSQLEPWINQLSGGGWCSNPNGARRVKYWQISGDRLLLQEVGGDVDLIFEREEESDIMSSILYNPLDKGFRVSQIFGINPKWYEASNGHNGTDWAVPVGNKVYAAQDGKVIRSEENRVGYGRQIRVQSSDGITIYGHLSTRNVQVGDIVESKQVIGLSGGAVSDPYCGNSTGPHLHFEYRPSAGAPNVPGGAGGAVDPMPLLVSHNYPLPDIDPPTLFRARCLVASLRVRSTPDLSSTTNIVSGLGYNEVKNVYEEKNGCYRIDPYIQLWCSGGSAYMQKIIDTPPVVTISINQWIKNMDTWAREKGFISPPPDLE